MNYLITAAGKGSRFIKEGIKPPKPLIRVLGNELLIWSLFSFKFNNNDSLFLVTYEKHKVKKILNKKIKNLFPNINIYWLELKDILEGQLHTALFAIKFFNIKGPLIIHNCDTFHNYHNQEIESTLNKENIFGIIPCFKGKGDHWSFAKISNTDPSLAIEVKEKVKISNNCSVGTYIFRDCHEFCELSEEYLKKNRNKFDEFFIAPVYQYAIEKNLIVKIADALNVKVFGTPKELMENFQISLNEVLGENAWNANQRNTLVVDIDRTICAKQENDNYMDAKPIKNVCSALMKAHNEGVYIILFTSRNMRTFKGSIGLINKFTAPLLIKWLSKNNIPYDELYFGKPWGNEVSYIDDKNLSIEDFKKSFQ